MSPDGSSSHGGSSDRDPATDIKPRAYARAYAGMEGGSAPGDAESSRPGESHPEALTEPCLNLSAHTAPPMQPLPTGTRRCPNHRNPPVAGCSVVPDRIGHSLRSSPITGPSSLLRSDPPLCSASVLSRLWVLHLRFSLGIEATGSHVPHKSPDHVLATFMPDAIRSVSRSLPNSSQGNDYPSVSTSSTRFRHFISGSLAFNSVIPT